MIRLLRALFLGLLFSVVVLSACGSDGSTSAGPSNGYVGTVADTDAFIAVVVSDDKVAVYACNGDEEIAEYFWGPVDGDSVPTLVSAGGATVGVELVEGEASGSLTFADGSVHEFTAVEAEGDAGLYLLAGEQADENGFVGGWVIDNDGDQRGALLRSSKFEATPRLTDSGATVGGTSAPVARIGITEGTVSVTRVVAPSDAKLPDVVNVPMPTGPIPIPFPN